MVDGETIHRPGEVFAYAYPPLMAWLVTPFAHWSPPHAQQAFWLANALATSVVLRTAWRLAGGPSLAPLCRRWQPVFWLAALLAIRFVAAPISHRQFDMLIAATLLTALWLLWQGRSLAAGVGFGLATAMKCTPLIFVPYFVWRRQFATAGVALVVAVVANLVPDWTFPCHDGGSYLADWDRHFLRHTARHAPGQWFADLRHNQSLAGGVNRGWRMWRAGSVDAAILKPTLSADDAQVIRAGTSIACLLALGLGGWPIARTLGAGPLRRRATDTSPDLDRRLIDFALEAGAVMSLMLLVSPMTSKAHFVVLLLPILALVRWTIIDENRSGRWILAALLAAGFCTSRDIVGRSATDLLHMLGAPTLFLLLTLAGCCHAITRRREQRAQNCQSIFDDESRTLQTTPPVARAA